MQIGSNGKPVVRIGKGRIVGIFEGGPAGVFYRNRGIFRLQTFSDEICIEIDKVKPKRPKNPDDCSVCTSHQTVIRLASRMARHLQ